MIRSKGEVVRGNQRAREVTLEPAAFHLTFTSLPRAPLPCNPRTWRASFLQCLGKQTALQKSTLSPCRTEEWGRNQEFSQDATNVDHSLKPHGRIWDWSTLWDPAHAYPDFAHEKAEAQELNLIVQSHLVSWRCPSTIPPPTTSSSRKVPPRTDHYFSLSQDSLFLWTFIMESVNIFK